MDRSEDLDYVVIGAGVSGLAFGILAAIQGKRVLIIEQHHLPGGCLTAFRSGPYTFNTSLEWTTDCAPGQAFHGLLTRLGLLEKYPFRKLRHLKTVICPQSRCTIDIPTGHNELSASLLNAFPKQREQIGRFLGDCLETAQNGSRSKAILLRYGVKSVESMLYDYFSDRSLRHTLIGLLGHPAARAIFLMYLVGAVAADELWFPVHGDHRRLPALMLKHFRHLGGKVALGTTVKRILTDGIGVTGIELDNAGVVSAANVVSTTDPFQLYDHLLPKESVRGSVGPKSTGGVGLSCFSLFLGLKRPVRVDRNRGALVLLASDGEYEANPLGLAGIPLRVECQSVDFPQFAPRGHATLCVWAATPMSAFNFWGQGREVEYSELDRSTYCAAKKHATEAVVARLETAFPGVREDIAVCEAATPFTYKRYTKGASGSVSGYSLGSLRYLKSRPNQTAIERLYHIGHWTTQSGISCAMLSAAHLADMLFATDSLERRDSGADGQVRQAQRQQ